MNLAIPPTGHPLDGMNAFRPEGVMTAMGATDISAAHLKPGFSLVDSPVKSAMERLPHLAARVQTLWGQTEFEPYVSRLIMESRDGQRQGLPWDVAQELFFLVELCIAKRALVAAEMTGASFREMFAQCLARSANAASTGPAMTHGWSDPMANKEAGRMGRGDIHPRQSSSGTKRREPMRRWWSRLLT